MFSSFANIEPAAPEQRSFYAVIPLEHLNTFQLIFHRYFFMKHERKEVI